jgi:adenine-specific DNA glycosylase
LQCVPSSPSCLFCPLSDSCVALQKNLVDKLPWKARKTKVLDRYFSYIYVRAGVHTFIKRREAGDIWQNLYEFPLIETEFRCVTCWGGIRENISAECSESLCCNYVSLPRNLCFPVRNLMFLLWKT